MKIYDKTISEDMQNYIISEVQKKKELNSFSEKAILKFAEYILKRDSKALSAITNLDLDLLEKNKHFLKFIKEIRAYCRRVYGVYITKDYYKKDLLLSNYDFKEPDLISLLKLHLSTKERLEYYPEIYKKLIEKTCIPNSILDLACGLNPLASEFIPNSPIKYFASDLSEKDVDFLNKYFNKAILKKKFVEGSYAFRLDLSLESSLSELNKFETDWCLILKGLDPIEEINENISYELVKNIKSKWIIVSFPTLTVSRKPMNNPRRNWFEKVLNRSNLEFETIDINNELFYIIKNTSSL